MLLTEFCYCVIWLHFCISANFCQVNCLQSAFEQFALTFCQNNNYFWPVLTQFKFCCSLSAVIVWFWLHFVWIYANFCLDFGTNRKRTYDFLLVINSNFSPILHRFRDTASYWLKIAYLSPFSHSVPSLPMFPLEFLAELHYEETTVMGLSYSEDPTIVARVVLTQC